MCRSVVHTRACIALLRVCLFSPFSPREEIGMIPPSFSSLHLPYSSFLTDFACVGLLLLSFPLLLVGLKKKLLRDEKIFLAAASLPPPRLSLLKLAHSQVWLLTLMQGERAHRMLLSRLFFLFRRRAVALSIKRPHARAGTFWPVFRCPEKQDGREEEEEGEEKERRASHARETHEMPSFYMLCTSIILFCNGFLLLKGPLPY